MRGPAGADGENRHPQGGDADLQRVRGRQRDDPIRSRGESHFRAFQGWIQRDARFYERGRAHAVGGSAMDDTAVAETPTQVFDLHALKAFASDKRVRKMLFKTDQLWSEIACYEPGQSTPLHVHPKEEEAIFVLEGTATMNIDGCEVTLPAGSLVQFPIQVPHDVRNLGRDR